MFPDAGTDISVFRGQVLPIYPWWVADDQVKFTGKQRREGILDDPCPNPVLPFGL
jgi:hypothetical protein